jgi:hypothetical protein
MAECPPVEDVATEATHLFYCGICRDFFEVVVEPGVPRCPGCLYPLGG